MLGALESFALGMVDMERPWKILSRILDVQVSTFATCSSVQHQHQNRCILALRWRIAVVLAFYSYLRCN
jgi:hypothetical protein